MVDRDSHLAALVKEALAQEHCAQQTPQFQHVWTRACAHASPRGHELRVAADACTTASVLAVLLAFGVGLWDMWPEDARETDLRALMTDLAANVRWSAPSDQLLAVSDRRFVAELPDIPMVDTSPEEWNL
jgi:hypothetical protein